MYSVRHLPQPLPEVFLTSFSFHLGELYWTSITGNKNGTRKCETDLRWEDGTHGGDSSLLYNAAYPAYTRHSHLGNCPEGLRHEEAPDTLSIVPMPSLCFIQRRSPAKGLKNSEAMYCEGPHCWKQMRGPVPDGLCFLPLLSNPWC